MGTLSRAHQILRTSDDKEMLELASNRIKRFEDYKKAQKLFSRERVQVWKSRQPDKQHNKIWLGYDPPKRKHFRDNNNNGRD